VTSAAVALTRQVGYENAGTVEFLLDNATGRTYFLEMNTRLQVEHPVTEMVTGLDLVELQLRVAAGEELPFAQADLHLDGHAIEARVYAEDSFGGFLPQAGTATRVRWPARARVDAALESGQVVSTAYDPMLGKVIVHGPDRESARRALVAALDDTAVLGFTTNVGFLRVLAASDEFRDATIDTAWLDTLPFERGELPAPDPDLARTIAAWVPAMLAAEHGDHGPFRADGFRLGAAPAPTRVELDRVVLVDRARGLVDDVPVTQFSAEEHLVRLEVAGRRVQAVVNATTHSVEVVVHGQRFVFERPDVFATHGTTAGQDTLTAPMPGTVLDVDVAEGDPVEEGQRLGVLEAMKMELALRAPHAGTVTAVGAAAGDQVALGEVLFVVEATDD
jgi:acetyl/propionyl-CoA carboxylase alpha subunit